MGSQFSKTRTVANNLYPIWNEYFEFVVDQVDCQKLRFELFDEDVGSSDEELGRLTIDLMMIKKEGYIDSWFPLEACKHGDLHVQVVSKK